MTRLDALRSALVERNIGGLIVTEPRNRFYISGFTGSSGMLVVTRDHAVLITDFRYVDQATQEARGFRVEKHELAIVDTLSEVVGSTGVSSLGFETDAVTYSQYETFKKGLNFVNLIPVSGCIESLRLIKEETELETIRRAASLADAAFSHILGFMRPGLSEMEVALELEWHMRKLGAERVAFDIIVASGERAALPHGKASGKRLARGELVVIDMGASYEGYASDMSRTVVLGESSDQQRKIYDIVLEAQETSLRETKAGRTGGEIDSAARGIIGRAGYGEYFGHGLGHGVGLAVHEEPRLAPKSELVLRPGMVATVEPGIYIPGWGGVRIEDLVVVRDEGVEVLSKSPKHLIEIV